MRTASSGNGGVRNAGRRWRHMLGMAIAIPAIIVLILVILLIVYLVRRA
jgi:hypothetical protein